MGIEIHDLRYHHGLGTTISMKRCHPWDAGALAKASRCSREPEEWPLAGANGELDWFPPWI